VSKERILYAETYRKGEANIRKDLLPDRLSYFAEGSKLVSMEIRKAGRIEIDGAELEFQDIRVICTPPEES
jgi:hypothetical protein